ncbi:response regulator [Verrucomicrobiota bacterium sgz303538]
MSFVDKHSYMPNAIFSRARVVIVDDESSNVRLLERILEMFGCNQIRSTSDSRQALSLCLEFEPDLVLLDLHMPHVDGFEVMQQLQQTTIGVCLPILVLTADVTVETKRRALASGAKDFLIKPLDHSEVVLRMKNLLENRFLHLELEKEVQERTAQLEETLAQLRSTQEQVIKQERLRALGMMAGGIAHDFNNALTMVLGYGELLFPYLQHHASPKEIGYLRNMISAAQDATHVVSRLRDFYRPVTGSDVRVSVDIREVIDQAISLTSPKWSSKSMADGVQIEVVTDLLAVPRVSGNAAELREVLTNLIFNSVDAMPGGGRIVVGAQEEDGGVRITVRDSGVGMSDDERERCLEPFFTTKGERGTGLGLAVVYGIIQRHKGHIEIESQKGVGTAFSFWLPQAPWEQPVEPPMAGRLDRTLRVLIVDDQEVIGELISEYLFDDGHSAAVALNGTQALEAFAGDSFDLVITDQSMPGMNGVQLANALKALSPQLPVILLTGFGEEMQAQGHHPEGVDIVIGKPVSSCELRRVIFQVMNERRPVVESSALACTE